MGDNNNSSRNRKSDQQANAWYDQINDAQPFDAFSSEAQKMRIGNEIYDRIQQDISRKRQRFLLPLKIAAAILVLLINSALVYRYFHRPASHERPVMWMTVTSGANELKKITLPDSSIIHLKSNSRICYTAAFRTGTERSVQLEEGAAFFDVKKDASRPFTVHSKGFLIRVLGTSFNISAYKDQPDFKVDVVSGRIRIEHSGGSGIKVLAEEMTKDQCLTVDLATTDYKIEKKTVSPVVKPKAVVRQLTLQQIGQELGDRFNLFVQLNNPENDTSTYIVDLNNRSLEAILKTLSEQTGFSYTIVNQQHLIIQPKTSDHME
ncbi:FecR family protein [Chitinophaga sp. S165]|uniref:FecR family protein n=1 Tax=Chitinophaga sp. S165 TaxID=2135462 RepID=UPI000D7095F3|nr:FecR family protein [Chitinophaga sp. S165]